MKLLTSIANCNLLPVWQRQTDVWGSRLTAPSLDRLVCLWLHRLGWMGKADRAFFERHILPGMVVVDVGANQGLYTLLFSQLVGDRGAVLAFEPETDMFRALEQNCMANGARNIECRNLALGSKASTAVLSRSLVHGGDNRIAPGHKKSLSRPVEIRVVTLDEVVGQRRIDFIKVDVQGWEGEVLRGMERTFDRNPHVQIYFEYWPRGLRNAGYDPVAVLKHLADRGFALFECAGMGPKRVENFAALQETLRGNRWTNLYATRNV